MTTEPTTQDAYEYFSGRHGNLHDFSRQGCEWKDPQTGQWHICYQIGSLNGMGFCRETEYRRKKNTKEN